MSKAKYRVEVCLSGSVVSCKFDDAQCAVAGYRHWARPLAGINVEAGEFVVKLWCNRTDTLLLASHTSGQSQRCGSDPEVSRALLEVSRALLE